MLLSLHKFEELLVLPGHIAKDRFDDAVVNSKAEGVPLEQYLVEQGLIDDAMLGRAIADGLGYRFINLKTIRIPDEVFGELTEEEMRGHKAIIFEVTPEHVKLATANPWDKAFFDNLEKQKGKKVEIYYATLQGVASELRYFKSDLNAKLNSFIDEMTAHPDETQNIVALLNSILEYAYENHASDVHIEPMEREVTLRFRIDGVLHHVATYPKSLHDRVVSRIKILARLRIDEHATPQDGRFTYDNNNLHFDARVSLAPITAGENVVIRILESRAHKIPLEELGISFADMQKISRAIQKPHGMILSVGPTGSGKTTTLYVLLDLLNKPEVNIMTIEDPVEYNIAHIQQMQVNAEKELLFATGLRAIVRQDPDIIMVGEIRDQETADIGINAAMTGHLLLSTMHANDAATTFPRFAEMGIEPFLSASSLIMVVGQRLLRKICEQCRSSYAMTPEEAALFQSDPEFLEILTSISGKDDLTQITLYHGAGCNLCGHTGYLDRTGIFEVMEVTPTLRTLIVAKANSEQIARAAHEEGMTTMLHDGVAKALKGVTTLSEVIRVIKT